MKQKWVAYSLNYSLVLIIKSFSRKREDTFDLNLLDEKLYIFLHAKTNLHIQLIKELIITSKLL